MPTPVEVPKPGNTVEECLIGKRLKRKGDRVTAGETIAEVETDKATFEVASPVDGTLLEWFFEEGASAPVYSTLCVIGEPGEHFEPQQAPPQPSAPSLSPRAQRFAAEHDFHPQSVTGSGPGGRVLEDDLRKLYQPRRPRRTSNIRARIAGRMRESLATTAQYTLHTSANAAGLLAVRARLQDVNINHLVLYCTVKALLLSPALNTEFLDGRLRQHLDVNLGFACDTRRGLLVPVIHASQNLTVAELAASVRELTARATQGNISPDDLQGATFTVSNLGALGIESFTPILNPPQVAILGVNAIQLKPVRNGAQVEFIDAIGLSLTCDHQAIDGAPAARFLQTLRTQIEQVEALCNL